MSYNDLIEDVPPLDQDTDSEEEVEREEFQYWNEDLASANFYFLKTGKSKKAPDAPGVVISDGENYKFQFSASNKTNTRVTFSCSEKPRTGCNAVARFYRREIPGADGEPDKVEWELYQLSSEMSHGLFHPPVRGTIIADRIMARMTAMMREDPLQDAVNLRDKVLDEDLRTLPEDDQCLVQKKLPLRPENTLNKIKNEMMGVIPQSRDQFDPAAILKIAHNIGGDKIIVLDSNIEEDLPSDWRNINMKTLFDDPPPDSQADLDDDVFTAPAGPASQDTVASSTASAAGPTSRDTSAPAGPASRDTSASSSASAAGPTSRDTSASYTASAGTFRRPASTPALTAASAASRDPTTTRPASTSSSSTASGSRPSSCNDPPRPPRVIIVTSVEGLSLLAVCRQGSVDGTFWIMSKLFAQLFIMLAKMDKHHLPVSFAYLPDKTFTSYYVFLFMLLRAFRKRRLDILKIVPQANLMMYVVKMDYEIAIHKAFHLFKRKVCVCLNV